MGSAPTSVAVESTGRDRAAPVRPRSGWTGLAGIAILMLGCVSVGALITGAVELPSALRVPRAWLPVILAFVAAIPLLLVNWRASLRLLTVLLVVEDLIRKYSGNDLRVFFAKDLVLVVLIIGLLLDPEVRGAWRDATGRSRLFLYAVIGWAIVMIVPSAFVDPRLPLVGLRLDFVYVPLVVVGWLIAQRREELTRWLMWFSVIGASVSLLGILQAVIGPSFLSPGRETPGLENLALYRGFIGSESVYQPTATFVDPGRFAAYAVLALAVSLAAFHLTRGHTRGIAVACILTAAAGVWVSGSRASLLAGAGLIVLGALAGLYGVRGLSLGRIVAVAASAIAALYLVGVFAPNLIGGRLDYYTRTLLPSSEENEWAFRWGAYTENTFEGLRLGGLVGQGTGEGSLGKQYLFGGVDASTEGLYRVEGGYAVVAQEWGAVGLVLWILWTVSWLRRQVRAVSSSRPSDLAAAGLVLLAWVCLFLVVLFFSGFQVFQNYVSNAYFWLLSGVIFAIPIAADRRSRSDRERRSHMVAT